MAQQNPSKYTEIGENGADVWWSCRIINSVTLIQLTVGSTLLVLMFRLYSACCSLLVVILMFATDTHCRLSMFKFVLVVKVFVLLCCAKCDVI